MLVRDDDLRERAYAFHNNGSGFRAIGSDFSYVSSGQNLRMPEFQGALLLAQMTRLNEQTRTRGQNGSYLTSMLREIRGIAPARHYEGCTNNAYHLSIFPYTPPAFPRLPPHRFLNAIT